MTVKYREQKVKRKDLPTSTAVIGAQGQNGDVGAYGYYGLTTAPVTIPASNTASVAVPLNPIFFLKDGESTLASIQGIDGRISRSGGAYSFQRTTSGASIVAPSGSQVIPSQGLFTTINIGNIASLRSAPVPGVQGLRFKLWGYYTILEANTKMPSYVWDATSSLADNGGTIIKPDAIAGTDPGRYIAVGDTFCPTQFGARPGGIIDCTDAIRRCLASSAKVSFTRGNYRLDSEVSVTMVTGSTEDVVYNFGNAQFQYNGSGIAFTFKRISTGNDLGRFIIRGGIIKGNLNALGAMKFIDLNQSIIEDVRTHNFLNSNAASFQIANENSWNENILFFNNTATESNIGLLSTGTVSPTGRELTSNARIYIKKFFCTKSIWAVYFNGVSPYHGVIEQVVGNFGGRIKAVVRLSGGAANLAISDCGGEQGYRVSAGTPTPYFNVSAIKTSDKLTAAPGTFPPTVVRKSILIPGGGTYNATIGDYDDLATKVTAVADDGSWILVARHVVAAVSNVTVQIYTNGVVSILADSPKVLRAPAGTFNPNWAGWFCTVANSSPMGGADLISLINSVAPDGSTMTINETALPGVDLDVDIGSVGVYQEPFGTRGTPTVTVRDMAILGSMAGGSIYVKGSNVNIGYAPDVVHNNSRTDTNLSPKRFSWEYFYGARLDFNKSAYALSLGGIGQNDNDSVGGVVGINLQTPGIPNTPDPTSYVMGLLDIRRGRSVNSGKVALVPYKNGVEGKGLIVDEDDHVVLPNGYVLGKKLTNGLGTGNSLVLLCELTGGNYVSGRVYSGRAQGDLTGVAAIDVSFFALVNKTPTVTSSVSGVASSGTNPRMATCSYAGKTWVALRVNADVMPLTKPVYFDGIDNQNGTLINALATIDESAATSVVDVAAPASTNVFGYKFKQSTLPTSPVVGDEWLEVDGSNLPIGLWTWNGTDWVASGNPVDINLTPNLLNALSANSSQNQAPFMLTNSKVQIISWAVGGQLASGVADSGNNWAIQLYRILSTSGGKTLLSSVDVSANNSNFANGGPISPVIVPINTTFAASALFGLAVDFVKTGTVANLQRANVRVKLRFVR